MGARCMDKIEEKQKVLTSHEAHKKLKNHLILCLSEAGAYAWANETGTIQSKAGYWITYGHKGSSDILAAWLGRLVAVEAKTGSGKQTREQIIFEKNVTEQGGIYYVAKWNKIEPVKTAAMRAVKEIRDRIDRDLRYSAGCVCAKSGQNCAGTCTGCTKIGQCLDNG